MAKTYNTVKTGTVVDRDIEREELSKINAGGGNPFLPTDEDIAAMSMMVEDVVTNLEEEMAALAAELEEADNY